MRDGSQTWGMFVSGDKNCRKVIKNRHTHCDTKSDGVTRTGSASADSKTRACSHIRHHLGRDRTVNTTLGCGCAVPTFLRVPGRKKSCKKSPWSSCCSSCEVHTRCSDWGCLRCVVLATIEQTEVTPWHTSRVSSVRQGKAISTSCPTRAWAD